MPITYPLDFPTSFGVSDFSFGVDHAVSGAESEFSFEEQIQEHPGVAWMISFSLELLSRDQAEEYNAFVLMLNGRKGTFLMSPPGSEQIRGQATGTVNVNGANQVGHDLNVDGLAPSTTDVFKVGDYIQLGAGSQSTLHKVLQSSNSNASGQASLLIAPRMTSSPLDGSEVIYNSPKGLFRAAENFNPVSVRPPNQFSLSLNARQAVGG